MVAAVGNRFDYYFQYNCFHLNYFDWRTQNHIHWIKLHVRRKVVAAVPVVVLPGVVLVVVELLALVSVDPKSQFAGMHVV